MDQNGQGQAMDKTGNTDILTASEFASHKLNSEGFEKAKSIGRAYTVLLNHLNDVCMSSPEFTIAKRKLEESCFYAKKAMAINLSNQDH